MSNMSKAAACLLAAITGAAVQAATIHVSVETGASVRAADGSK
jgi:hypothetical protein